MAWAPKYGLKGMIDASIRVKITSTANEVYEKIMPFEFKTGKGTSGQASFLLTFYLFFKEFRIFKNISIRHFLIAPPSQLYYLLLLGCFCSQLWNIVRK